MKKSGLKQYNRHGRPGFLGCLWSDPERAIVEVAQEVYFLEGTSEGYSLILSHIHDVYTHLYFRVSCPISIYS
jgi:hypothetical protein